jgi:hypothetical protein
VWSNGTVTLLGAAARPVAPADRAARDRRQPQLLGGRDNGPRLRRDEHLQERAEAEGEREQVADSDGTGGRTVSPITAFVRDHASSARAQDHAEAVLTHHDTPGTPVQDLQTPRPQPGCLMNKLIGAGGQG